MYMQEFRYGKVVKIFLFLFCSGFITMLAWGLFEFYDKNPKVYFFAIVPVCVAMMALGVFGIIDVIIGSFLISSDRVSLRSPFGYKTLLFDEIRGYRVDDKYIRIIPIDKKKKQINVSPYLKNSRAIIHWLEENYPNLEVQEGEAEERAVLDNEALGITEEQRADRLNQARKVARMLNGGAWVLLIWMLFFKKFYAEYGLLLCAVYPLIAAFATLQYRGIMTIDDREGSKLPTVTIAMIVPGVSLALRVLTKFNVLNYPSYIWAIMALISIVLTIMYMLPSFKSVSTHLRFYGMGALMVLLNLFYGYGVVITANCMFDKSPATDYHTTVASKSVSNGKITTYSFKVSPWGTRTEEEKASVTREQYESVEQGDSIIVREHLGSLRMAWIEVVL